MSELLPLTVTVIVAAGLVGLAIGWTRATRTAGV